MSNRYSLSQTCNPRPTYRVIDHTFDDEIARYPATLPNGSPHPKAGQPRCIITSPSPAYRVQDEGRARTSSPAGRTATRSRSPEARPRAACSTC